ncbi:hypothetical protein SERLADRAFT_470650 [Serpula lacrymans var. lacrymans S7.9]|uniref:PDZ GRASP-type domain-containing protein n=1 Tax=Serpula lacrymans var. lacrymans (strain S7.9) TaxID=578457 RepID=F8NZK7_SERL9|nr:uncharacterized protein SERLADRAFT_470650 [Serpula lacrymans var. lacrymans S7.9]EGO24027.1 hypothetical protein SERLADRAFT_470650 [Serpula lacrymans var. lacrymans S7.9]
MGAGQSTASQAHSSRALHVLRVTPSSPASQTSIEPFFDFIIGFEGDSFISHNDIDVAELETIVEKHENRTLNLLVWNNKTRQTRVLPIVPSRTWSLARDGASGTKDPEAAPQPSLLGLSMRMCEFESATDNVWHVLEVLEGSPAESAGLVPYGDWIIGWSGGVLSAENDFYDVVESHVDKPLRVYVYSHDFDNLREVVLVPNRQWGGEGLLGCVFGYGLLHRIPPRTSDHQPDTTYPGSRQSLHEYEEQDLFVPADGSQDPYAAFSVRGDENSNQYLAQSGLAQNDPENYYHSSEGGENSNHPTPLAGYTTSNHNTPSLEPSEQTPTRARQLGHPMNGVTGTYSLATPRSLSLDASYVIPRGGYTMSDIDDDSDGDDGGASVSGTETTDYGSLTSVE